MKREFRVVTDQELDNNVDAPMLQQCICGSGQWLSDACHVSVSEIEVEPNKGDEPESEGVMNEFNVGDKVRCEGTVVAEIDGDADINIEFDSGRRAFVRAVDCILIDPDALTVGDLVQTDSSAPSRTIEELVQHYRVRYPDGSFAILPRERITKLQPKPTHRVDIKNDRLLLLKSNLVEDSVHMSDIEVRDRAIVDWGNLYNIDADEARKLIAVPTVIETITAGDVVFEAFRTEVGWHGRVTIHNPAGFTRRCIQAKEAERLFPNITGRCYLGVL